MLPQPSPDRFLYISLLLLGSSCPLKAVASYTHLSPVSHKVYVRIQTCVSKAGLNTPILAYSLRSYQPLDVLSFVHNTRNQSTTEIPRRNLAFLGGFLVVLLLSFLATIAIPTIPLVLLFLSVEIGNVIELAEPVLQ